MATNVIWWAGTWLLVIILIRGVQVGFVRKYPLFYAYISCVFLKDIVDLLTYHFAPSFYKPAYWPTELATIVASYVVIVEIFRSALRDNSGIARESQKILLFVFALTLGYAATAMLHREFISVTRTIVELGRDLRYIEGGLLLVMLWLFVRYRISVGRNLLGLIAGYSFWVGLNVVNLSLWLIPGNEESVLLHTLLPLSYVATLAIWCFALWSLQPEPARSNDNSIERDYQLLAAKTRSVLTRSSARLARVIRP
jgi:uncharacterized membrane protein